MKNEQTKFSALLVNALIAITFVSGASRAADKTVTHKEKGFEITFPEAWTVEPSTTYGTSPKAATAKGPSMVDVLVGDSEGKSLKEHAKPVLANMLANKDPKKENTRVDLVELKLDGRDGYKLSTEYYEKPSAVLQKAEVYFLISGKSMYAISAWAQKDDYDIYAKEIDAIVKSFKLLPVK